MCEANQTQVTQIYLFGFQPLHKFKPVLFTGFLLCYLMILIGNLLIIVLVSVVDFLKIPMFFFLTQLSIADVLLTTSVVPKMLDIILAEEGRLSFAECIIQLYCFCTFGFVQCFLIAIMSYDRYLAICNPLIYTSVMIPQVCFWLIGGSWLLILLIVSSEIILLCQFNFCGSNKIDDFFCDFGPVVELSTSDTSSLLLQDFVTSIFAIFFPFVFIIITYICIAFAIMKISSASGRKKAFSTCSSHLMTVCTYYVTLIIVYIAPTNESGVNINKYRSLLYVVATPLMNPIIYSLRNKEIKKALIKLISSIKTIC
ncbi:olfactory receptor 10A7-like [Hyperolius riggenbachi]|uniref:olfactory receptor 10A7-like n=1 Tax=Hyperolius riggenbachi TaxID=752182 RepID=UPI0035A3A23E